MDKLIINQNTEHPVNATEFSYNVSYQIDNHSVHSENFSCRVEGESISNLNYFENTPITSIAVYDEEDTLKTNLTFGGHFYLTNGSMGVFDTGIKLFVSFNTVYINENVAGE